MCVLTCDCVGVAGRLAARNENDIALARVGILVLEKEEVVDAVVAQSGRLDDDAERAGEVLLNDEVLLAADLRCRGRLSSVQRCAKCTGRLQALPLDKARHASRLRKPNLLLQVDTAGPCGPFP